MSRIAVLDHGYVEVVESWGSDQRIVESARMSTGKGFLGWGQGCSECRGLGKKLPHVDGNYGFECPKCKGTGTIAGDEKLLRYLYENAHSTPFEFAGLVIEVQAPIFVFREWHRHRTQCLAGDTMLHFELPGGRSKGGGRRIYKMPIAEAWRKWQPTVRASRPERQENALWNQERMAGMQLRCVNEETGEVVFTSIVDIVRGEPKQLFRVTTIGGRTIRASADHQFFTNRGWMRLEDAVKRGAFLAVERTAREMALSWETAAIDERVECWRDVVGWEGLYEVSDAGRVRRVGSPPKRGTVGHHGYPVVNLNRPGVQQTRTVHTLVLEAWKGARPPGCEARHLNSNRIDARVLNLEWGTPGENANDRVTSDRQQRLSIGYEEIAHYEQAGFEPTYDLAVRAPWHNFVADGFIVHNSYNEASARYAPLPDLNYVPTVERLMLGGGHLTKQAGAATGANELTPGFAEIFRKQIGKQYQAAEDEYQAALKVGIPKELARLVLPVGRYSKMRAATNFRNWLAFMTLRQAPNAQWEIRQYANVVHDVLLDLFPRTMELFDEGKARAAKPGA